MSSELFQSLRTREPFFLERTVPSFIFKVKMPSIKTLTSILGGNYYHIFNRGSNRQNIFYSQANYIYFLHLINKFPGGYVHFLAYALLPNHFHLVVKVKEEVVTGSEGNRSLQKENGSLLQRENSSLLFHSLHRKLNAFARNIHFFYPHFYMLVQFYNLVGVGNKTVG